MITVQRFTDFDALTDIGRPLLDAEHRGGVFLGEAWFRTVLAHAMPADSAPLFLLALRGGHACGLIALRTGGKQLESLTTPYSCAFAPLLAPGLRADERITVCAALAQACRAWPILRLDALDPDDPPVRAMIAGARAARLAVRHFDHFGNWHEHVAGLAWADYLAQRPSQLRNTVRRRMAAAQRAPGALIILRGGTDLQAGIAAYEDVYARSWKQPEPFPSFNAAMMRAFAPLGQLRLGLMRFAGQVIAAQIWLVADGIATVVKLAHDEAHKGASPGTVLTAHMLRHLLDEEHVREIDFGRGDDPYKQGWAGQRRQKIGIFLINPRRATGLATLARQTFGDVARKIYRRRKPDNGG